MKVIIQRDALLKPLQMISGVVEKRQTMPILANVLIRAEKEQIFLTGTDLEIELIGSVQLETPAEPGIITVSARKLLDICRALPENAKIELSVEGTQVLLRSEKSRFILAMLPPSDFPSIEQGTFITNLTITQSHLKKLIGKIHFAMGQQDVRHYLNGVLLDVSQGNIKCVATDGHRLAYSALSDITYDGPQAKIIIPRKSILELIRLLDANSDELVTMNIGDNHFRIISSSFTFTSKLISAQYPDYDKLIPKNIRNTAIASREALKQSLTRASILSNEKFRGIRLNLEQNTLKIVANNPEQEEAEEVMHLNYQGADAEIGFNVSYLLDVVSTITFSDDIRLSFSEPNAGILMEAVNKGDKEDSLYVVMPMRL